MRNSIVFVLVYSFYYFIYFFCVILFFLKYFCFKMNWFYNMFFVWLFESSDFFKVVIKKIVEFIGND